MTSLFAPDIGIDESASYLYKFGDIVQFQIIVFSRFC